MNDTAGRFANRVQRTTGGHRPYLSAVEEALGGGMDYAQLVKLDGASGEQPDAR
jgi:hypothetical protein